jgi:hypothetical protein
MLVDKYNTFEARKQEIRLKNLQISKIIYPHPVLALSYQQLRNPPHYLGC